MKKTQTKDKSPNVFAELHDPLEILSRIKSPFVRDLVASAMMSEKVIERDDRPEWVVRATAALFDCFFMPAGGRTKSQNYKLGYFASITKRMQPEDFGKEKELAALLKPAEIIKALVATTLDENPSDAADMCEGLAKGLKNQNEVESSGPTIVFALLALQWREIQKMKNLTELHSWFTETIGSSLTGSRDRFKKLTSQIGLRYSDKGGRPKKGKPGKALSK